MGVLAYLSNILAHALHAMPILPFVTSCVLRHFHKHSLICPYNNRLVQFARPSHQRSIRFLRQQVPFVSSVSLSTAVLCAQTLPTLNSLVLFRSCVPSFIIRQCLFSFPCAVLNVSRRSARPSLAYSSGYSHNQRPSSLSEFHSSLLTSALIASNVSFHCIYHSRPTSSVH